MQPLPKVRILEAEVPKLILGHLPFIGESYQGKRNNEEYEQRFRNVNNTVKIMTRAVSQYGITVFSTALPAQGNLSKSLLFAIRETSKQTGTRIRLIPCLKIPLRIHDMPVDDYRRWLTYLEVERRMAPEGILDKYLNDPILNCREGWRDKFHLVMWSSRPYRRELRDLSVDYKEARASIESLRNLEPLFIEPGSETDFLAMTGRLDLLSEFTDWIYSSYGHEVVLGVHHAGSTIPILEKAQMKCFGYLTPVNKLGAMMFPNQSLAEDSIRRSRKPIIAIKPLGGGRLNPLEAFEYVFKNMGVSSCMLGVASEKELDDDARAANSVLTECT